MKSFASVMGNPLGRGGEGRYPVYGSNGIIGGSEEFRHENAIVIGRVGAYCGSVAYCPTRFWASDNTLVAYPASSRFDTKFLYYLLTNAQLSRYAGGAAQPLVTQTVLKGVEVSVPEFDTQRRIASILSAYDDLIENNQRRIQILETMARNLYREWFVHFRFPGHEKVRRVSSPLGEIPEGWEVKKLGDICSKLIDGTHDSPPPVAVGYPLITGRHIKGGFIDFSDAYNISPEEHQKVMKRSRPEQGDVIYSNIGTLGATALVDQEFEYSIKNVALFKPLAPNLSAFIYCFLESPANLIDLTRKASGTSQKFFSLQFLRAIELVVPAHGLLQLFSDKLAPILGERTLLNKKTKNLNQTRNLLLPRLLSGEAGLGVSNRKEAAL